MPYSLPHDASLNGHRVDEVLGYLTVTTGIVFAVMAAILLAAVLFHRGRARTALYTHGTRARDRMVAALAGAVVLFGIDAVAVVRSDQHLRTGFWTQPENDPNAFRVEVTAQQWSWTFRYPGADGKFGTRDDLTSLNDLRVPVDVPVLMQLTSKDVVHAMYLPNFRNKIDAIPGTVTRMWFQARETGTYEIGCAQHCGAWHYKMRGALHVLSADAFARWQQQARDTAAILAAAPDATGAPAAAAPVAGATAPVEPGAAPAITALPDGWPWVGSGSP